VRSIIFEIKERGKRMKGTIRGTGLFLEINAFAT
jgi:hypothetical protein